jgi:hypothetical protein
MDEAPVIGIDFDNTLVSYDALIHDVALERRLIAPGDDRSKRAVRDRIRLLPEGEVEWQKVQALVYGPLMGRAQLMPGAEEFIRACRSRGWPVYIVSHKTEFAGYDETGTNLRDAALAWMASQGFFGRAGLGFSRDQVFFEGTRGEKIERIRALRCTHFIDDLEEVFLEPSFPPDIRKCLFRSWPVLHVDFFAACS